MSFRTTLRAASEQCADLGFRVAPVSAAARPLETQASEPRSRYRYGRTASPLPLAPHSAADAHLLGLPLRRHLNLPRVPEGQSGGEAKGAGATASGAAGGRSRVVLLAQRPGPYRRGGLVPALLDGNRWRPLAERHRGLSEWPVVHDDMGGRPGRSDLLHRRGLQPVPVAIPARQKEMTSADVQGKREAASRWANHVSADDQVGARWNYLLVSEADVETAKGSWEALTRLGQ
jgi:hypothetical protein